MSTLTVEVLGEFAPHPYQSLDPDGHIITVNNAWLDILGYDLESVEGAWFGDFLPEDSKEVFESRFEDLKREGGVSGAELALRRADGGVIHVRFDGAVEYDEDGSMVRTHCQFVDITDERDRLATIRRLSEYRRVVSAVAAELVKTDAVHEMLPRTTDIISGSDLFGCTFLALIEDRETDFVCESGSRMGTSDVEQFHTPEYVTEVFENGTLHIPDVTRPPYEQHVDDHPSHPGLAVAIQAAGMDYGILTVHFDPDDEPNPTEVELIERLADDIGTFLRNQELERERERQIEKVAKRERLFRELHTITRDLLAAESESRIFTEIVDGLAEAISGGRFAVFRFDEGAGVLELHQGANSIFTEVDERLTITPRDGPLWEVFQDGQARFIEPDTVSSEISPQITGASAPVALSLGDYGLLLAAFDTGREYEDVDLEMLRLCTANAEAILGRKRRDRELGELGETLEAYQQSVEKLQRLMESVGDIQAAMAESETREEVAWAVCEELVATGSVDFAWIAQPERADTDLSPTAWAGTASSFGDYVRFQSDPADLPAQTAAETREAVSIQNISERVQDESWAKEALTSGFQSTVSIPILHEDVLYGVLSVFSDQKGAFDSPQLNLLEGIGSMLGAYLEMHTIRVLQSETEMIELEFSVSDRAYPLGRLAAETGSTIRFVGIVGSDEETVEFVVRIESEGEADVREAATNFGQIRSARWLGDSNSRELIIEQERPCLATRISKYGARFNSAVADPDGATITIRYPANVPARPLFEHLQKLYSDIELVARRETATRAVTAGFHPSDILTERQLEILKAAFFGGYYDTPRGISGEELATSFDISNSAVSKHLRAAQRSLLEYLLDSPTDNQGFTSQP